MRALKAAMVARADGEKPLEVAKKWVRAGFAHWGRGRGSRAGAVPESEQRAFLSSNFSQGGALVPPEMAAEIIELLYAQTVALAMGARTLEFRGSINLGKITSGATVSYVGEAVNITPSQPGTGELHA